MTTRRMRILSAFVVLVALVAAFAAPMALASGPVPLCPEPPPPPPPPEREISIQGQAMAYAKVVDLRFREQEGRGTFEFDLEFSGSSDAYAYDSYGEGVIADVGIAKREVGNAAIETVSGKTVWSWSDAQLAGSGSTTKDPREAFASLTMGGSTTLVVPFDLGYRPGDFNASSYQLLVMACAYGASADGNALIGFAWDEDELVAEWSFHIPHHRTSEPVAEHVQLENVPSETRWVDTFRIEMDGRAVRVPAFHPSDQGWTIVHGDLSDHGMLPCVYVIIGNDPAGTETFIKMITVFDTGSNGDQAFDVPNLPEVPEPLLAILPR